MLAVFVSDLELASNSTRLINNLKENLTVLFKVKIFGKITCLTGQNIEITSIEIKIDQRANAKILIQ